MSTNTLFYQEYASNLDQVQNNLLSLFLKFRDLKTKAEKDYEQGIINAEEYARIKKFHFNEYYTNEKGKKSPYSLNQVQIAYIKKYAALDAEGDLLVESLQEGFYTKKDYLYKVFDSIRKYYFYDSIELETLKNYFSQVIAHHYDEQIAKKQATLLANATDIFEEMRETINSYIDTFQKHKEQALLRIENSNRKELYILLGEFGNIDYSYYDWFVTRTMQEEAKNPNVYEDHQARLERVMTYKDLLTSVQNQHQNAINSFQKIESSFHNFLQMAESDLREQKRKDHSLKSRLLNKLGLHKKNNLSELAQIFSEYINNSSLVMLISTLPKQGQTDDFAIYMSNSFPRLTYVNPSEFRYQLINDIKEYYIKSINSIHERIINTEKYSIKIDKELERQIQEAQKEATHATAISRSLSKKVTIEPVDDISVDRIFADMTEYFNTEYKSDKEKFNEELATICNNNLSEQKNHQ